MEQGKQWETELLNCCSDVKACCYGVWCCPCLAFNVAGKFGENACLPLCDILSPALFAACGIPMCAPPAVLSLRAAMRHKYNIEGSLCNDIIVSCFCMWCSWCQMNRELGDCDNKTDVAVVNAQPQNIINIQNTTVMSQSAVMGEYYGY